MSLIDGIIRRLDVHVENVFLDDVASQKRRATNQSSGRSPHQYDNETDEAQLKAIHKLQRYSRTITDVRDLNPNYALQVNLSILQRVGLSYAPSRNSTEEEDLRWLLVAKAVLQLLRSMTTRILEETLCLEHHVCYWEEVLDSHLYTGIYWLQVMPWRFWQLSKVIYADIRFPVGAARVQSLQSPWRQYYHRVHESIRKHSILRLSTTAISRWKEVHNVVREKLAHLSRLREIQATSLGLLFDQTLWKTLDEDTSKTPGSATQMSSKKNLERFLLRSLALMEIVCCNGFSMDYSPSEFEEIVLAELETKLVATKDEDHLLVCRTMSERMRTLIQHSYPRFTAQMSHLVQVNGPPPTVVRYWIPVIFLALSSITLTQSVSSRQAQIKAWLREIGDTTMKFWSNWVLDPTMKIFSTIRHDEDSEVALMSKGSLMGDRESLQRMVVDFSKDHNHSLTQTQLQVIHDNVKEGDLTPVLKSYEMDLRRPFVGTVRGDLIRALLIQVQKTKVDIEVAISGIDALLKSQELVFGFLGLTPGVLICIASFRWISGFWRKNQSSEACKTSIIKALHNVDKLMNDVLYANSSELKTLPNKEYGLVFCEVQRLRQRAISLVPSELATMLSQDIGQLLGRRTSIEHQIRIVNRIQLTCGKYWA